MNENVSDKIDIDIVKERPLHDVLASIHLEIGICHAVSCIQWCLPNITISYWSRWTFRAIFFVALIVCMAYSTLEGVELARLDAHAMIDAFADIRFDYWVINTSTKALDSLLANVVDWCWKGAQIQLKIYCNIRQSPTSWVIFRCAWWLGDHLRDCLCDLLVIPLPVVLVVSCNIGLTEEVLFGKQKIWSWHTIVSVGAIFFSGGAGVAANCLVAILVKHTVVSFLVISVILAIHCVFADIDAVLKVCCFFWDVPPNDKPLTLVRAVTLSSRTSRREGRGRKNW